MAKVARKILQTAKSYQKSAKQLVAKARQNPFFDVAHFKI